MKTKDIQIRDPFILKVDGKYFLYGSTDKDIWRDSIPTGFDTYVSDDLQNWDGPYEAFRPSKHFWGTKNFWAPEVHEYNDAYYMFATFYSDTHNRGTAILKSETPFGPFEEWSDGAVTPKDWMSLDGTLYIDKEDKPWIVFCHEWVQIQDGTICAMQLSEDLKSAVGEPIVLFKSSDVSWSEQVESKSNNITGFVTDGCNFRRLQNGKLIMVWSCIGKDGYCIGYHVSDNDEITGQWKEGELIFSKDGGHGMIFTTYEGEIMLAIHQPNQTPNERAHFYKLIETEDGFTLSGDAPLC